MLVCVFSGGDVVGGAAAAGVDVVAFVFAWLRA